MDTVQVSYGQYIFSPNPAAVTVKNRRTAVTEPLPGGGEWLAVTAPGGDAGRAALGRGRHCGATPV